MRSRRGSQIIEFALLFPIQVLLILGVMDAAWGLHHLGVLDAAAHRGCRAGSLMDPGEFDQKIEEVQEQVEGVMRAYVEGVTGRPCEVCVAAVWTEGAPPLRRLRCRIGMDVPSLTGVMGGGWSLSSEQHAKLEWQREAGP